MRWGKEGGTIAEQQTPERLRVLTARVVGGYLRHNKVAPGEVSELIASMHRALGAVARAPPEEPRTPAVPVRRSVGRDFVVCLECSFRGQMLRRHLMTNHELTPAEYRARWNLSADHPIVAPTYAERRSTVAKAAGFGRRRGEAPA